jgi:hypothetical protein
MSRGFVIMAQGDDYVKCATALELSIKRVMPNANVTIITTDMLPYGDQAANSDWKLQNDWQVYEASPYDETIKLEADMIIPRSIEHWFNVFKSRDLVVCDKIRNFKGELSKVRTYRRFIDDNNLPDCYNAITYFKKSDTARRFFGIVRDVFENWSEYKAILKCNPQEEATTDWAYSLAAHIIGKENVIMPGFDELSMIHMKQFVNGLPIEDWTTIFIHECSLDTIRINTFPQTHPFHYHIKSFADKILEVYND